MSANPRTFEYIRQGVETLVMRGCFRNGKPFRPTQHDALWAYHNFLNSNELTQEQKLRGFFEIPTGVGKTAAFLAILDEAHRVARAAGDTLRVMIVVPTVPILEQMRDEIAEWAPDYLKTTGFYGGGYRKLGEELTVIIYNSWVTLMEQGKIDSSNVDILVSDEAHRGTSERRLTAMFNAFANGTVQLAFSATTRFDEEKSVEQTHGTQIFGRGVGESVRLGELASYIQTQLYIIRVQPPANDEDDAPEIRAGKRQEAWMRQMVAVMRDGRDNHTGDLLTDNKSGIYVYGTAMADRFAKLASEDPELRARAKAKGCKAVVLAVHSKMHPLEQEARLNAFKRGECLGLVSDEKLKEGFNDPAMKNVFDYPRGSLVDKAQIIGRAARQWWNAAKERLEGATIVDTIVYIGDADPKEDRRLKDDAIRNAVMAWSVLETGAVFSLKNKIQGLQKNRCNGIGVSVVHGLEVESIVDLESINSIHYYQESLDSRVIIEGYIRLTEDMQLGLKNHVQRTGVKPWIIAPSLEKFGERQIVSQKIYRLISSKAVTVKKTLWEELMQIYKNLEDASKRNQPKNLEITSNMRIYLDSERNRTNIGARDFLKKSRSGKDFFTEAQLDKIFRGITKKISEEAWSFLLDEFSKFPESKISKKITLTDEMRKVLQNEIVRTGISPAQLLKRFGDYDGKIGKDKIGTIVRNKKIKSVEKDIWDWIIEKYKKCPALKNEVVSDFGLRMN